MGLARDFIFWMSQKKKVTDAIARRGMKHGFARLSVLRWYGFKSQRNPVCPTCNEDAFLSRLEKELEA